MGAFFSVGEQKIRPGTYMRVYNSGGFEAVGARAGVCAAVFKSDWGPLGAAVDIYTPGDRDAIFGNDNGNTNKCGIIDEMMLNVSRIVAVRLGTGGTKASKTIKDTTGVALLR